MAKNNINNKRVAACYVRYSSTAQDDGFSIEAQTNAIYAYAEKNGYDIQYYYEDKAKTGTNDNRPQFQQMIADAKQHLFECVIVHKGDRFSRNRLDATTYKNILKNNDVEFISVTEDFGSGAEADMMEAMQEVLAEYYSKNLAREVRKGLNVLASKGLHTGGVPPLGYDVNEERKLVINESEAEIVRLIFNRYADNYTYNDIAKELNAKGYKTKAGNEFSIASFNSILSQRKYIGEYVYNRRSSKDMRGKTNAHKYKAEDEILRIPNAVPRIIDDATFEKVQARLALNKHDNGRRNTKSGYLLSGVIICGKCGFRYSGNCCKSRNNVYYGYRCGKRQNHKIGCGNGEIERNRLETFVLEQMQKYLFSDQAIKEIVRRVNEYRKETAEVSRDDIITYQKQLKNIDKQLKNITEAIAKGVGEDIMIEKINALNASKKDIQQRIKDLTVEEFPEAVEEDIRNALSKFKQFMQENNYIECKRFIDQYIDSIVVGETTVEVTFKVASAFFNADFPDDKSGKIQIVLSITREELKKLSKQRRKVPKNGQFGKDYLKEYRIVPL